LEKTVNNSRTCQLSFPHAVHLLVQVKQQVGPVTQQQPPINLAVAAAAAAQTWSCRAGTMLTDTPAIVHKQVVASDPGSGRSEA
jgi:hypothetical protein